MRTQTCPVCIENACNLPVSAPTPLSPVASTQAPVSFYSQPQAMEVGGRDVAGLLWNHEVHTYGDDGAGTTSLAVGRGPEHLPPPVSTGFFQVAGFGMSEPQRVAPPPPPVTMTVDTAGGAAAAAPSLRDLLFDKWPPAPLNELSMAEPLV